MRKTIVAALLAACAACTACTAPAPQEAGSGPASTSATVAFPRTVRVGEADVTVPAKPQRIAVLTPDLTALALPLAGKERVVMAAEMNPELGQVAADANSIEHVLKVGAPVDPEHILSASPDLVLISARSDSEKDATAMLRDAGLPLAVVSTDAWTGIDDILTHIGEVSQLLGEEAAGEQMRADITQRRAAVKHATSTPSVATIVHRGGKDMIMGKSTILNGLVREAGGRPIIDTLGAPGSVPADPEALLKANPEVIIVQKYRGRGADELRPLLDNPALAQVPAIKNGRVYYVDSATTGVTSAAGIVDGLEQVAGFLSEG
ncbi:ABC transporter substrate-binding protein [Corynebacterium sp. H128]|uniref:ABC transporter substrate-binding protein n=1 Tax=Corynebacterium sp. H128 TaxID=3133427 RepID=UPI0030A80C3D